ncbi:TetR/AcrR family transcriptional regulator [Kitasatospora sp. NBC_01250]|uniref:helix-turn-helix domain-containing protein n=1 Tax=Kitasatospora sp. NBC_01250 TaxID=2903571 RepID=UPI002E310709|nr:helix-turn-helix domain-containing protein [Kitasatospora sp. NBC_01250]
MPKQARGLKTRGLVLDAAAREFAQYGYAEANLQRIADRIGMTKGALYAHFATKEELAEVFAGHLAQAGEELLADQQIGSGEPLEGLRALMLGAASLLQQDDWAHAAFRLAVEEACATGVPPALPVRIGCAVRQLVARAQQGRGCGAAVDPAVPADLVVAVLFGAYGTGAALERAGLRTRVAGLWELLATTLGAAGSAGAARTRVELWRY